MLTYGWAILIIVIVAAVLYSLGIFNPSANISATVTGFSGFSVQAQCFTGGALIISLTNGNGYIVNITGITADVNGMVSSQPFKSLIAPGQANTFPILSGCTTTNGQRFSSSVTVLLMIADCFIYD